MDNTNQEAAVIREGEREKLTTRNLMMFSLGTFGRDFLYGLFSSHLLNFILFTKQVTDAQFASITFIIIAARLFDAFNDPIMGGLVENTYTKWGKFKPWQLIGAVTTGAVIVALFTNEFQGQDFIWFLAIIYFMFSITFTMNDISYWGMLPSLTSNEHDRSKLTSVAQLVAGAGGALVGLLVPALTVGKLAINGNAVAGYKVISVIAAILMIAFQLFTLFGVKEKPLGVRPDKNDRLTLKKMFLTIAKNDQLLWITVVMLIFSVGGGVVGNGLSLTYIYFEFGYNGILLTLFGILFAIANVLFTLAYPWLNKRFSRTKMVFVTGGSIFVGYILMLILGLTIPTGSPNTALWYAKFCAMAAANGIIGFGQGFYMIMVISIANTVEYNEYKTGKRDEGLIFSLRPFTAKLSSALVQGLVAVVYIAAGVLNYTNRISSLENDTAKGAIDEAAKLAGINEIIKGVSDGSKTILLVCMCIIPAVFICVAMFIYKKKFILDDKTYKNIVEEIARRKQQ